MPCLQVEKGYFFQINDITFEHAGNDIQISTPIIIFPDIRKFNGTFFFYRLLYLTASWISNFRHSCFTSLSRAPLNENKLLHFVRTLLLKICVVFSPKNEKRATLGGQLKPIFASQINIIIHFGCVLVFMCLPWAH